MARPTKPGLDYFPLNVNFSEDEKIEIIEAEFKETGFYVILKIFMRIYGMNGYYMMFTSREQKLFSKRINVDINSVIAIINSAINEKLFDKTMYEKYGILTSKGIQSRYLEAVERRTKVELIKEFLLINVPKAKNILLTSIKNVNELVFVNNNSINVCNNSINDNIVCAENTQSKGKESKEKESKVIEKGDGCVDGSLQSDSCVDEVVKFYEENIGAITPYEFNLLDSYRADFSDDIIIYALKLQVEAKATSIKYAKAILNNWQKKNIKTLLDAKRENGKRKPEVEKEEKVNNLYQSNDSQYQDLDRFYTN